MNALTLPQKRALWAAGMLLIAAAAGALAFMSGARGGSTVLGPAGAALPGFAVDSADVTEYLITTRDGAYRLTRGKTRWVLMERGGYPALKSKMESLVAGLVNLKLDKVLTQDPEKFEALRLTDPRQGGSGALIQAIDAKGDKRAQLLVGMSSQGLLVRHPGEDRAFLVHGNLPDLANPAAFADLDALKIGADRVQRVDLLYPGGATVSLLRSAPDASFTIAPPDNRSKNVDLRMGSSELSAIALKTTPFRPAEVQADAAETPAGTTLGERRITTFDGLNIRMVFAQKDGAIWMQASAGGGGSSAEAVAINSRTSGWAFAYDPRDLDLLFPPLPGGGGADQQKKDPAAKIDTIGAQ